MATQSPIAKLRETAALVVAVGQAVSDESKKVKQEAASRGEQALVQVNDDGRGAGQQTGS